MASYSSASAPSWKYDVFLSFSGEDTRRNFVCFLRERLEMRGIKTFIDDKLRRGDQISPALLQAIEDSRFSIVIFSENYAYSSWCLDELTKILECVDRRGHTAFPVFYEMDPSHVRKQKGSYEEAFREQEEAHKNNSEKVDKWRQALNRASKYSGWDTRGRDQSEVIREIVSLILNKISASPSSSDVIGMESRIEAMLSLLHIGSDDVRMVGIWGMAGIGKTTLAKAICQRIRAQFEGHYLLLDVRKKSTENLLMELLSKTLPREEQLIRNLGSDCIKIAFNSLKVLIVLDDVDHINQLDGLVGKRDWFGRGSRIIITTRDMGLLKDMDAVYEAMELQKEEALSLFCLHAFKDKLPLQDFEELCISFLDYTKGNPLVIKTLGAHLYKRTKGEWKCDREKLKKIPNKYVQEVLRISFDGLEDKVKNIFLDIACFLKGEDKDYAFELLNCFDFYPKTGIRTLVERALITISYDNRLCMHDLIQEMGWEIVRQESIEYPGERSRLWLNDDVRHVLTTNSGTKTIQGIVLDLSASKELLDFKGDAFKKMIKLRWLEIRIFEKCLYDFGRLTSLAPFGMHLRGDLKFQSQLLGYLRWEGYPLKSLPSNFDPRKLFELNMSFSRLKKLCKGKKSFPNLEYMDLSHSRDLIRTPDLSGAPKLREINLKGCTSLVEVDSSIETLEKLTLLNLGGCNKLREVAKSFCKLTSLVTLNLCDCSILEVLPKLTFIKTLNLCGCLSLRKLPEDFGKLTSLETLNLKHCLKLEELPKLTSIKTLNLCGCLSLRKLPEDFGKLTSLETLNLEYCSKLEELPYFGKLTSLETLNLKHCSKLEELPKLTAIKTLNLCGCLSLRKLPEDFGKLTSLETLNLENCSKLEELPYFGKLTSLESLNLKHCSKLKELPKGIGELTSLKILDTDESGIQEVPHCISLLTRLEKLSLGCKGSSIDLDLSFFGGFQHLEKLALRDCNLLEVGPISSLRSLRLLDMSENSFISLPSLTQLTNLFWLKLEGCKSLRALAKLPTSIVILQASKCKSLQTFSHPPNSYAMLINNKVMFDLSDCGAVLENEGSLEAILDGIRIFHPIHERMREFGAVVPGRSVPEWFIHRSEGDSIIVKLPPDFYNLENVGLGFCATLRVNPSDQLCFGYVSISEEMLSISKHVSHLKFSFPPWVTKCGIRLLYSPVLSEENAMNPLLRSGEMIMERETVNATSFFPPPTMIFDEPLWKIAMKTMVDTLH